MKKKLVIIGGSAAGAKAAARARRLSEDIEIIILDRKSSFSTYSCSLPHLIGKEPINLDPIYNAGRPNIIDKNFFKDSKNIDVLFDHDVLDIEPKKQCLKVRDLISWKEYTITYDKLIIATGLDPHIFNVPGSDLLEVSYLRNIHHADFLTTVAKNSLRKPALVLGGGLIGIKIAESLSLLGLNLTIIEKEKHILNYLDPEISQIAENHIREHGINIVKNDSISRFIEKNGHLHQVELNSGKILEAILVAISLLGEPNISLAKKAGIKIGQQNAISVNEFFETSIKNIYAVGDCAEVKNAITNNYVLNSYSSAANLEGRIVAENALNNNTIAFPGLYESKVCNILGCNIGTIGINTQQALEAGFTPLSMLQHRTDLPSYMPEAKPVVSKVTIDKNTKRVLGIQIIGTGNISRPLLTWGVLIQNNLTIDNILLADLPYSADTSQPIDLTISLANMLDNKIKMGFNSINPYDLKTKLDQKNDFLLIDNRTTIIQGDKILNHGEIHLTSKELRQKFNDLPRHKEIILFCLSGVTSYESVLFLKSKGFNNISFLEGGISAWPY